MSTLQTARGGIAPPLWLNHSWGWEYADPDGAFAAAEVDVYLDLVGADTPTRVTLDESSPGVTRTATSISVDQTPAWVGENLSAGTWRVHLLVDEYELAWWQFQVLTPDAGAFTP